MYRKQIFERPRPRRVWKPMTRVLHDRWKKRGDLTGTPKGKARHQLSRGFKAAASPGKENKTIAEEGGRGRQVKKKKKVAHHWDFIRKRIGHAGKKPPKRGGVRIMKGIWKGTFRDNQSARDPLFRGTIL